MPSSDSRPPPPLAATSTGDLVRVKNLLWLEQVVRPAFELFTVGGEVRGYGPVVVGRAKAWCVEIPSPRGPGRRFDACVGLEDIEKPEVAAAITGEPDPFPRATAEELSVTSVVGALTMAFRRWKAVQG